MKSLTSMSVFLEHITAHNSVGLSFWCASVLAPEC